MVKDSSSYFDRLYYYLEIKNWSISKLSCEAEISENTLHASKAHNRIPKVETCLKICDALGVTLPEFFNSEPTEFTKEKTLRFIINEEMSKIVTGYEKQIMELKEEISDLKKEIQQLK